MLSSIARPVIDDPFPCLGLPRRLMPGPITCFAVTRKLVHVLMSLHASDLPLHWIHLVSRFRRTSRRRTYNGPGNLISANIAAAGAPPRRQRTSRYTTARGQSTRCCSGTALTFCSREGQIVFNLTHDPSCVFCGGLQDVLKHGVWAGATLRARLFTTAAAATAVTIQNDAQVPPTTFLYRLDSPAYYESARPGRWQSQA